MFKFVSFVMLIQHREVEVVWIRLHSNLEIGYHRKRMTFDQFKSVNSIYHSFLFVRACDQPIHKREEEEFHFLTYIQKKGRMSVCP